MEFNKCRETIRNGNNRNAVDAETFMYQTTMYVQNVVQKTH